MILIINVTELYNTTATTPTPSTEEPVFFFEFIQITEKKRWTSNNRDIYCYNSISGWEILDGEHDAEKKDVFRCPFLFCFCFDDDDEKKRDVKKKLVAAAGTKNNNNN